MMCSMKKNRKICNSSIAQILYVSFPRGLAYCFYLFTKYLQRRVVWLVPESGAGEATKPTSTKATTFFFYAVWM
jgi:hypothetical protein